MDTNINSAEDTDESFYEAYHSKNISRREDDHELVQKATVSGVVPQSIRYTVLKNAKRGAITDRDGNLFYFISPNDKPIKLIKAETEKKKEEIITLFKACKFGCDLIKGSKVDEDDEEEKKAQETAASAATATVPEEQNIREQHSLATDVHPGAAASSTPDANADKWHGEEASKNWDFKFLLSNLGQELKKTLPGNYRVLSSQEKEFLVTVAGKTPQEVEAGNVHFSPTQRVLFNQWMNKSLSKNLGNLQNWLKKK